MSSKRLIVVGSGIVGLANALVALERGWSVTIFERTSRPLGASVRNFGTIWPIGQELGTARSRALRSAIRWRNLSKSAQFTCDACGSLHLAYHDDAWSLLTEFRSLLGDDDDSVNLLGPEEVAALSPAVRLEGLRGGLFSSTERCVIPREAIPALVKYLEGLGVHFHFSTPVVAVHDDIVETSYGDRHTFDRLLICGGDELRILFPKALGDAGVTRTKLQMMRTVRQPDAWRLGPILASELTLRHYASFRACPSADAVRQRINCELPECDRWGIHVLAVQRPSGELVLGDSHEYGTDFSSECSSRIDDLILEQLTSFLNVPDLRIEQRWTGSYLKSTEGKSVVVLEPRARVQVVTALGGAGMTLAFGLADELFAGHDGADRPGVATSPFPS